jgi:hypothetical protein
MNLHLDRFHFGLATSGAVLQFRVRNGAGFAVRAVLDCEMSTVARWEWIELQDAQLVQETLVPPGIYTLELDVAFLGPQPTQVLIDVAVNERSAQLILPRGAPGNRPDIGRGLAVVIVS